MSTSCGLQLAQLGPLGMQLCLKVALPGHLHCLHASVVLRLFCEWCRRGKQYQPGHCCVTWMGVAVWQVHIVNSTQQCCSSVAPFACCDNALAYSLLILMT